MYYLLLILLYPVSLLPMWLLYRLADIFYLVIFYIVGYRKELVLENLRHAYPEKTTQELKTIRRKFYLSFCDQWIETLKLLSISSAELKRRFSMDATVLDALGDEGKDVSLIIGHTFNWEWANVAIQLYTKYPFALFYMPLESMAFDRIMRCIRQRSGSILISMKAKKAMQQLDGKRHIIGLAADQNPSDVKHATWLPFMHREAPFFKGPEKLARRGQHAVVFIEVKKIKRGYYNAVVHLITKNAADTPNGEILQRYAAFMEQQLREQPENWLWTHRRWKYNKADYAKA